jgi:ABC-type sugar transport system ATPase subunit
LTLGDRVVVMRDGRVQQVGDPMELYNRPANRFVAGFIGSPAMNFAQIRITARNGGLWAESEDLRMALVQILSRRPISARLDELRQRDGGVPEFGRTVQGSALRPGGRRSMREVVLALQAQLP